MSHEELKTLLETTGLPVAHEFFTGRAPLPCIVYLHKNSDGFSADNRTYYQANEYQVELYSEKRNETLETLLEGVLDQEDIYYEKSGSYIKTERMYQMVYQFEI